MKLKGKIIIVTGAAGGIGKAMAVRFANEGAAKVICTDINFAGAKKTASYIGGQAYTMDATREQEIANVIKKTEEYFGPIDLFCSNAGISIGGGVEVSDKAWQKIWDVNVMSHVFAARAVLPSMLDRGEGYLLNTSSAAGLLSQVGSAPYSVTKHAAIGFAEWLSITYGKRGIKVSALCPQAVRTAMTAGSEGGGVAGLDGMLEPEQLADSVVETLAEERFLVLPHPEVLTYMRRKTEDYDRWLGGMRRLHERFEDAYKARAERDREK